MDLLADAELFEFLAQCAAVDAENGSRAALVSVHVAHHDLEQRFFNFPHHKIIQLRRLVAVEGLEIALQGLLGLRTQWDALAIDFQIAAVERRRSLFAGSRFLLCDPSPS